MYAIRTTNCALLGFTEIESGMARRVAIQRDEREHNSEDDEHDDGAGGVEALVPKEDGEGADIEDKTADKNAIAGKEPGVVCWLWHF